MPLKKQKVIPTIGTLLTLLSAKIQVLRTLWDLREEFAARVLLISVDAKLAPSPKPQTLNPKPESSSPKP